VELLSKMKDAGGRIQIPGIYDDVEPPSADEKASWQHLPFDEKEYLENEVGSTELTGEAGYSVFERTWARPTLEVHGIGGGFTGAGSKTVIPAKAVAKVSIRLVPRQDPNKVMKSVEQFVKDNAPRGVRFEVRVLGAGPGLMVNTDNRAIQVAAKAFSDIYGKQTVFTRSGGSIPIVGDFATHVGIPTILMGFGLPDDGLHSPNEKYSIRNYYDGIRTIAHFFEEYGK
jgi:acetylornithine deacetylase/succinyl-diaminopimelate desuccinylase-like protein